MAIQPRILVVDDHHDTVDLLVQLMVGFEYRAIGAESFREALVVAAAKPFDLYILDLELPDGDGCDLLHQLHAQRAAPAIAITGLGLPEDHERAAAAGFDEVLLKPFVFADLQQAMERALGVGQSSPTA